jgi:AAA domain
VLIIDEAQNLSPALLEEVRILSDLESPDKLLQVVLVGQLELRTKLKLPEMRQLDQRVSARCSLEALTRDAVAGYVSHRLSVAGGAEDRVHFSPNAIDAVFRVSGGTPRVVNLICDRALHRGHLTRRSTIDLETVTEAIDDLGVGTLTPPAATLLPTAARAMSLSSAAPVAPPAPSAPVATVALAPPAPAAAGPVPQLLDAVSTDLSGLEVHEFDGSAEPTKLSIPAYSQRSMFGRPGPPRRRWRGRLLRWAAAAVVVFGIVFFALLGEAVFINYFPPLAELDLRLPGAPAAPRVAPTNTRIATPADVTLPPPPSEEPPVRLRTAPRARE